MNCCFRPGKVWRDTKGKLIQAHGFTVQFDEQSKQYYWFGENKEYTRKGGKIWHWGVRLYTSQDLYNWEDRGLIIPPEPDDLTSPLHPTYCMDRPHIIYCPKTEKYVAWLKIMGGVTSQFMSVMTADKLEGPYEFDKKIYKPLGMDTGDFTLHMDAQTGKGYIFFERPHFELICADLTEDFTAVTGYYSCHYTGKKPPYAREAPTFFERNGKKYLFTSGTTGYYPNPTQVCMFDDYRGDYVDLGNPCVGDWSNTSFNSQFTSVFQIHGTDQLVACGDRWMPFWYIPFIGKLTIAKFKAQFKDYVPDTSEQKPQPLPGVESIHQDDTWKSRYVWLPIEWEAEKPVVRWHHSWRWEDLINLE